MRFPVAANIALHKAGARGGRSPGSAALGSIRIIFKEKRAEFAK
jgi:hypothetical protein